MSDDSVKTISAMFATREAADRAVEHLVQQCGIARANVFVQARESANTAGIFPSGGDATRPDAPLHGEIEVSADISNREIMRAEHALRDAGARNVMAR